MGPAISISVAMVMSAVFEAFPIVKPPNVLLNVQPELEKALEKEIELDSIIIFPVPDIVLEVGFGASFFKTNVPSEIVVLPEKVLLFVRVSVPVPDLIKFPEPEMIPDKLLLALFVSISKVAKPVIFPDP